METGERRSLAVHSMLVCNRTSRIVHTAAKLSSRCRLHRHLFTESAAPSSGRRHLRAKALAVMEDRDPEYSLRDATHGRLKTEIYSR